MRARTPGLSPLFASIGLAVALGLGAAAPATALGARPLTLLQEGADENAEGGSEPTGVTPDEQLVEQAVVLIEMRFKDDKRVVSNNYKENKLVQFGFMLEPNLGVTSFSALVKADSSSVRRLGKGSKTLRLNVIGADPVKDIAIFTLGGGAVEAAASSNGANSSGGNSTGANSTDAEAQAPSNAATYPLALDASTAPLDPSNYTLFADIEAPTNPELWRAISLAEMKPRGGERADQILVTATHGRLSGLPIVDVEGRLVGMWQWSWATTGLTEPSVLPVAELRRAAAEAKARPKKFPGAFVAAASQTYAMPTILWGAVEQPANAAKRGKAFLNEVRCGDCDGKGSRREEERTWDGVRWNVQRRDVTCSRCKGDRLTDARKLWSKFRTLASILTNVRPTDDRDAVRMSLEEGLKEAFALNVSAMYYAAHDGGKEELARQNLTPGRAIVFLVPRIYWPEENGMLWEEKVRIVDAPGLTHPPLILRNPTCRTLQEGCVAFVAAVVAGELTVGEKTFIVLDRAFVVPVKSPALDAGR